MAVEEYCRRRRRRRRSRRRVLSLASRSGRVRKEAGQAGDRSLLSSFERAEGRQHTDRDDETPEGSRNR